jgi:hypothetical protein
VLVQKAEDVFGNIFFGAVAGNDVLQFRERFVFQVFIHRVGLSQV